VAKFFFAAQIATGFSSKAFFVEIYFSQWNQAFLRVQPPQNSTWHCHCLACLNADADWPEPAAI
jgi:hypothetical protein